MSELRRQVQAALETMAEWPAPDSTATGRTAAAEMARSAHTLRQIQRKARGIAAGYGQTDPLTWVRPLDQLARYLEQAAAWWADALTPTDPEWTEALAERMGEDFEQLGAHCGGVLDELSFSARAAATAEQGGARQPVAAEVREIQPPSPFTPLPPRRPGLHYAANPGYRRRRRWGLMLAPAGLGVTILATALIIAATSGNHTAGATLTTPTSTARTTGPTPAAASSAAESPTNDLQQAPLSTTAPSTTAASAPAAGPGTVTISLTTGSAAGHLQAAITVRTGDTAATPLYIDVYGVTPAGQRTPERLSTRTLAGATTYTVTITINATAWCGDTVTVAATATGTAAAHAPAGC